MASRSVSIDEATRPLMSEPTLEENTAPGRLHPDMVVRPLSPPAEAYHDEDGREKAWPLNKVLMWIIRPLAVILAFTQIMLQLTHPNDGNNGRGLGITLVVFTFLVMFWNLFKIIPNKIMDTLLMCAYTAGKGGDTEVSCTMGRWKVFCYGGDVEEGDCHDQMQQQQPVRKLSPIKRMASQGAVDLVLASFLMLFDILFATEYRWYWSSDRSVVALASILVGLQYIMVFLPHISSCGPISITLNYNPNRHDPYQYHIRLPEDESAAQPASRGKDPVSVTA
ncbi:hypothetical protein PG987_001368 [Apiospora arundinis]